MNRPKTQMPKRPRMVSTATARTSKEAAIGLVRLEFDATRLQLGIEQAENRVAGYQAELDRNKTHRKHLLHILNDLGDPHET